MAVVCVCLLLNLLHACFRLLEVPTALLVTHSLTTTPHTHTHTHTHTHSRYYYAAVLATNATKRWCAVGVANRRLCLRMRGKTKPKDFPILFGNSFTIRYSEEELSYGDFWKNFHMVTFQSVW